MTMKKKEKPFLQSTALSIQTVTKIARTTSKYEHPEEALERMLTSVSCCVGSIKYQLIFFFFFKEARFSTQRRENFIFSSIHFSGASFDICGMGINFRHLLQMSYVQNSALLIFLRCRGHDKIIHFLFSD